jgi:ribose transport system ATP-binding protein
LAIAKTNQAKPLLEMTGISKAFVGVRALDDVDFDVRAGEVHALIGENGAGKSTLVNIIAGRFSDYKGSIIFDEKQVRLTNPHQGRKMGIAVIYQELSVLTNFTVAENIMLGDEKASRYLRKMDRVAIRAGAREVIDYLNFDLDPDRPVAELGRAHRCMVEIAAAVRRNVKLIVFDEPTACLASGDVEKLFGVIKDLCKRGLGVIYISHRIAELPVIADRVTVLRDAKVVGTKEIADCNVAELTRMMLGHELAEVFCSKTNSPGEVILKVKHLSRPGVFEDISFELREGEILGIAGLVGSGRTEIARAIFGADKSAGMIELGDTVLEKRFPHLSRNLGIAMVPENRKTEGNISQRPVSENINITILDRLSRRLGFLRPKDCTCQANRMIERMNIEPANPRQNIENLSGGNQQKVIIARWLGAESRVIIFDEPTQGIDVGTKAQLYKLIIELACKGHAIILISSEMLEIAKLADRILIIQDGRMVNELNGPLDDETQLIDSCYSRGESK